VYKVWLTAGCVNQTSSTNENVWKPASARNVKTEDGQVIVVSTNSGGRRRCHKAATRVVQSAAAAEPCTDRDPCWGPETMTLIICRMWEHSVDMYPVN
jgi:hypothetical protein